MLQHDDAEVEAPIDGRVARRERNIAAVLDVVIEMYGENMLIPTIEQASTRSGLSLRSVYRYFADPGELHRAAIEHHRKLTRDLAHLEAIGEGPLDERIARFVDMRSRLYEAVAPVYRASMHTAATNPQVAKNMAGSRGDLTDQFNVHFAAELVACGAARCNAADALTQLDSIELMRHHQQLSIKATKAALTEALTALLAA